MTSFLTNAIKHVGQSNKADDDLIDRLNHRFTVILLVSFIGFVGAKQFVGSPISCWTPSQFSGPQVAYTNTICWLKGSYYLESNRLMIPHRTENSQFRVAYYQYVSYMLAAMALIFYLPHMFWRFISKSFGFDLRRMIEKLKQMSKTADEQVLGDMVLEIDAALQRHEWYRSSNQTNNNHRLLRSFQHSTRLYNPLTFCYLIMKILYVVNCFFQFYLLTVFLSFPFHTFGIEWLMETIDKLGTRTNIEVRDSKWFPRVVMCDFMVRQLGSNPHWMAIQCSLPINLFNEIIFLIFWIWLIVLTILSCFSLLFYIISISMKINRTQLQNYLHSTHSATPVQCRTKFLIEYLQIDGILLLQILSQNANDIVMRKLVDALFENYRKSPMSVDDTD